MLISYSHKFLFFHVPKVAGISIREALKAYVQEPEHFKIARPPRTIGERPNPLYEMWSSTLLHARAKDVRKELPGELYRNFFKFAFVRNPWDWQVSMYHFLLHETTNPRYPVVKALTGFEEYLEWVVATNNPYPKVATKFQKDILTDAEGNLLVDFVGRYETLEQNFRQICQTLKLAVSLPHLNKTGHRDYRLYYTERTKCLLADHFKDDIELFGYTFDGYFPEKVSRLGA